MDSKMFNIIVTGSNRGLGRELINIFCEKLSPYNIILAVRSVEKSQELINNLRLKYSNAKLHPYTLDVTNSDSINSFLSWYVSTFKTIDILINNAGVGFWSDLSSSEFPTEGLLQQTMETNLYGLIELTEKSLPYLSEYGKIVNVSSGFGSLKLQPEIAQKRLQTKDLTTEEIIKLAKEFEFEAKSKNIKSWSNSAYKVSKALVNAYTKTVLTKKLREEQTCLYLSPGWCKTQMGTDRAPNSVRSGAEKLYFAAIETGFGKDSKYNGKYIYDNLISDEND